ncbi:MAG: sigma 54-dependent Fis family transcriptional regulator [Myxococcales bacterium]|nr:sigma 54-dependent Fis family transcriptional regulator [Myxococcales bacterium]
MTHSAETTRVVDDKQNPRLMRRKLRLEVMRGPDRGKHVVIGKEEVNIGTLPANDLVLSDTAISRYHVRVSAGMRGFVITDLDSTNGTFIGALRVREVTTAGSVDLIIGGSTVRVQPLTDEVEVPLSGDDRYGTLLGRSPQMRAIFAQLSPIASSDATVLIDGETGTGKEGLAEEIHRASARAGGPFVIVDCGAIPDNLIESELFGHMRGSFTGATSDRVGAFELADGGTVFLDEIGEMSAAAQPKLLRALESRQVKPVGSTRYRPTNARIIAATNRDLRRAINEGSFRADLYYRLSVVRLHIPPLRERPEDVELLAEHFLEHFSSRIAPGAPVPSLGQETRQRLMAHRWPGNVRELRNFMERVAVLAHSASGVQVEPEPVSIGSLDSSPITSGDEIEGSAGGTDAAAVPLDLPYKEAKARWIDHFEIAYVSSLLDRTEGNVAAAAREAGVDRTYLFRLIRKYKLRD